LQGTGIDYEALSNKLKHPTNAVDLRMDLLLSRPENRGENQLITNIKPQISTNTVTSKKVTFCTNKVAFLINVM